MSVKVSFANGRGLCVFPPRLMQIICKYFCCKYKFYDDIGRNPFYFLFDLKGSHTDTSKLCVEQFIHFIEESSNLKKRIHKEIGMVQKQMFFLKSVCIKSLFLVLDFSLMHAFADYFFQQYFDWKNI